MGLAVFSHYPLDVLVHLPDLPITGNDSPKLGLGLWNHPVATMVAELLVFGLGLAVYLALRSKRYPVRAGRLAMLVIVLLGTYFASIYGPLPPNMTAVAVSVSGSSWWSRRWPRGRTGVPRRRSSKPNISLRTEPMDRPSSRSARCPP